MSTQNLSALIALNRAHREAKQFYLSERNQLMTRITTIAIQSLIIGFLVWLAFFHFPQNQLLWTTNARTVCKASAIDQSEFYHSVITQFAQEAAIALNDYGYLNYRRALSNAADRFLTTNGRDQYFKSLDETGIIDTIKKNYYTVTSFVSDPPQIKDKGVRGGRPFWNVEVPITIWYAAGQQRIPENRVLTMTILAVDPTPLNTKGIGVDNIVSTQRVKP